jgi:hypothetical protein
VSQGAYRIHREGGDLIEVFVAAPGPGGWRWFGRVHDEATGQEMYVVDHVVDADWRLVRFRLLGRAAGEIRVEPAADALAVTLDDVTETASNAEVVWSPSPASLLVLDRFLRATRATEARGVHVLAPGTWEAVTIELQDRSRLLVDGARIPVTWSKDVPEGAAGWFDLLPQGYPLRP